MPSSMAIIARLRFPLLWLPICFLFLSNFAVISNQFQLDARVLELDDSNFDATVSNIGYILIDFYAPWCGHCKRLTPELEKAASVLVGLKLPIAVAKVDADKYKTLASKYNISGYPTLKIFIHGTPTGYYGPWKADALVRFVKKFVAPDVAVLQSDPAIRDFIDAAGSDYPIFVGFGLNESVIMDLAIRYKKKAWFSVAEDFSDEIMTRYDFDNVPALAAIHPAYNEHSIFYGPFEGEFLQDYVRQSFLPLVLPINKDSLKSLKDDTKKVMVTILEDETAEKYQALLKVLKAVASANRDIVFGYVGVKQWKDFADLFKEEDDNKTQLLPKMVVWDGQPDYYYTVIGCRSIDGSGGDMGKHDVSRFVEGYREGRTVEKRLRVIRGPTSSSRSLMVFMMIIVFGILVLVVAVVLILWKHGDPPGSSTVLFKED